MTLPSSIDITLVPVIQRKLKSITEEMGLTLLKTTRSPILNEARDFVTGLYDDRGRMLEQCEYAPILSFSLQPVCRYIIGYFGMEIFPGDVIIHNDVYTQGNQLPDVAIFEPIFLDDRLIAWVACKGHQADIGGNVAGGYNPKATEIWQEGLRIPPVKLYERGKLRKDVWNFIFANVRYDIVQEDILSQIGGCTVGERRYLELVGHYGLDYLNLHLEYLLDSTEKMMRREIQEIPEGTYHGESIMYDDGITVGSQYIIRVHITVRGSDIFFDYTGTDPQAPGFTNATANGSASAVLIAILNLVNPNIPHNDGMLRPIHMTFPGGSIVNARFPAATTFSNHLADHHFEAIFKALSEVLPKRVTAGWNRLLGFVATGFDPRKKKPYVDILFNALKGGGGASFGIDGYDHIGLAGRGGGIAAQDPEVFEQQDPHFLLKFEFAPDSAGAGRWRGGLGVETVFKFLGISTKGITFGDGIENGSQAFGLFGGKPGGKNRISITYPDGFVYEARGKDIIFPIPTGSIYRQETGGGGGYGDPFLRPVEMIIEDVRNELIPLEKAQEEYGVIFVPGRLDVDLEGTQRVRQKKRRDETGKNEISR